VGQQIRLKNIGMILDSLAELKDRGKDFLFYSLGTGAAQQKFIDKTKVLGLSGRAIFPGEVSDRTELFSYYAAADLFLFPSLYDTYGNVIREAALMHTPSLLVRGTTCAAPFQDGVDAFIAGANDPQVYADKIIETMRDVDGRRRVSDLIEHTLSRTWEDVVGEVVDRYDVLIRQNRSKGTFRRR
jgi:1,2-diacylglycerol 3-alpha-glucosyltransferase